MRLLLVLCLILGLLTRSIFGQSVPNPCINDPPACDPTEECFIIGSGNSNLDSECRLRCDEEGGQECLNGGTCNAGTCACHPSFEGPFCQWRNRCRHDVPYTCYNSGVCQVDGIEMGAWEYTCVDCLSGFGPTCGFEHPSQIPLSELYDRYRASNITNFNRDQDFCTQAEEAHITCDFDQPSHVEWIGTYITFLDFHTGDFEQQAQPLEFFQYSYNYLDFSSSGMSMDVSIFGFEDHSMTTLDYVNLEECEMTGTVSFYDGYYGEGYFSLDSLLLKGNQFDEINIDSDLYNLKYFSASNTVLNWCMRDLDDIIEVNIDGCTVSDALGDSCFFEPQEESVYEEEELQCVNQYDSLSTFSCAGCVGLTGSIPSKIYCAAPSLVYLDLSSTGISGTVPETIFDKEPGEYWFTLKLTNTSVSGVFPWQAAIDNIPNNLKNIYVDNTNLTGSIPTALLSTTVEELFIAGSNFDCSFPDYSALTQDDWNTFDTDCADNCGALYRNESACYPYRGFCTEQQADEECHCYDGFINSEGSTNCIYTEHDTKFWEWWDSLASKGALLDGLPERNATQTVCGYASDNSISAYVACEGDKISAFAFTSAVALVGTFPTQIGSWDQLTSVRFSDQPGLTGSIPLALSSLSLLEELVIINCTLSGTIHPDVLGMESLISVEVTYNNLTGSLPDFTENLELLSLRNNKLSGSLSTSILYNKHSLVILDLLGNEFSGALPFNFFNATSLARIDLSENQFSGEIPVDLLECTALTFLNLGSNQLTGTLPADWIALESLEYLNLEGNQLEGFLPEELLLLITEHSLDELDLSDNQFEGDLTEMGTLFANLSDLDLADNLFTGSVYDWEVEGYNLLKLSGNDLECSLVEYRLVPENDYDELEASCITNCADQTNDNEACYPGGGYCLALSGTNECLCKDGHYKNAGSPNCAQTYDGAKFCEWVGSLTKETHTEGGDYELKGACLYPVCPYGIYRPDDSQYVMCEEDNIVSISINGQDWEELEGTFPTQFIDLAQLSSLSLSYANLSGTIPSQYSALTLVRVLYLSNLVLHGSIPTEIGLLSSLTILEIGRPGANFTSTIPSTLTQLEDLTTIDFSFFPVTGDLPDLSSLPWLASVTITDTGLEGDLMETLEKMPPGIILVDLGSNELSGRAEAGFFTGHSNLDTFVITGNRLVCPPVFDYSSLSNDDYATYTSACSGVCGEVDCGDHGACLTDETCLCDAGFQGELCTNNTSCDSSPCANGGTCTLTGDGYNCTCSNNWFGSNCDQNYCGSSVCQNGGNCTDQGEGYHCVCPAGFNGTACQNAINMCSSSPCEHGATCTNGINDYTCTCAVGWEGETCSNNVTICLNRCKNGGECTVTEEGFNFTCECLPGFEGRTCQTQIGPCKDHPCKHNATCENLSSTTYECTCDEDAGYEGANCTVPYDHCLISPCQHGGTCTTTNGTYSTCDCPPGVSGTRCQNSGVPSATASRVRAVFKIHGLNFTWLSVNETLNPTTFVDAWINVTSEVVDVIPDSISVDILARGSIIVTFTILSDDPQEVYDFLLDLIEGNNQTTIYLTLLADLLPEPAFDQLVEELTLNSTFSSVVLIPYVAPTAAPTDPPLSWNTIGLIIALSVIGVLFLGVAVLHSVNAAFVASGRL